MEEVGGVDGVVDAEIFIVYVLVAELPDGSIAATEKVFVPTLVHVSEKGTDEPEATGLVVAPKVPVLFISKINFT